MNIVKVGDTLQVFGEGLQTFRTLPTGTYEVSFNPMKGFALTERPALEIKEDKIYGVHGVKVEKVLNAFSTFNRNLGVILSGQKGIGKSLFARILAAKAVERDIPLIIVSEYNFGIANFIDSIQQEVIVLFDEFEKTFDKDCREGTSPQEEMLSLFDGIGNGKKLFVITCNDLHDLSSYLLNRPGRFHYHFTLSTPNSEEIREYMMDKLKPEYQCNIEKIINFAAYTEITYDCLRAIAFELNNGYTLKETLGDLNILKTNAPYYNIIITFMDGTVAESMRAMQIDFFSEQRVSNWMNHNTSGEIHVNFVPSDANVDPVTQNITMKGDKMMLRFDDDDEDGSLKKKHQIKEITFLSENRLDRLRYMV